MIYDYDQPADNPAIRIDAKYDQENVRIHDGILELKQKGFSDADFATKKPISMAGIQSRRLDIIHGTFRSIFKVTGSDGGSCASFFWYRNDASEIDIEAVTRGTSFVNNTISYTTQPSVNADGSPIANASLKIPLSPQYNTDLKVYHEHRFDCDLNNGVKYYLDGQLRHFDVHNIPKEGGNLQLKLWADGNKWWSGYPSKTAVTMSIRSIIAYFNTSGTEDGTDTSWFDVCQKAGGPSDSTICEAFATPGYLDDTSPALASSASNGKASTGTPVPCDSHTSEWLCMPQRSQAVRNRGILTYPKNGVSLIPGPKVIPQPNLNWASRLKSDLRTWPWDHVPALWMQLSHVKTSQATRPESKLVPLTHGVASSLPGGSQVHTNQAPRANLPTWFSLGYTRNASTVAYRYLASMRRGNVRRG